MESLPMLTRNDDDDQDKRVFNSNTNRDKRGHNLPLLTGTARISTPSIKLLRAKSPALLSSCSPLPTPCTAAAFTCYNEDALWP